MVIKSSPKPSILAHPKVDFLLCARGEESLRLIKKLIHQRFMIIFFLPENKLSASKDWKQANYNNYHLQEPRNM